jgi:glutamate racemase
MNIGVFDSGLGGLTVVSAIKKMMKGVNIFYVADTKHAPYGDKTPTQIRQYSLDITAYLIATYKIDALVLACNTATSFAIESLRLLYPNLIIIGTEPGIKPAILQSKRGKIAVLATPATLKGSKYQSLATVLSKDAEIQFFEQACHGLVEQIEKGELCSNKTKALLSSWLMPMKEEGVDTIVLGCTHYPLVAQTILHIMNDDVVLIDTGMAIGKRLLTLALHQGYKNAGSSSLHLEATGHIVEEMVSKILHHKYTIHKIIIN